jgi:hypothetical protein
MKEFEVFDIIRQGNLFKGLSDIRVFDVQWQPELTKYKEQNVRPDVDFTIDYGGNMIKVYGEVKSQVTPKILREIGQWISRIKTANPTEAWVLICPFLSEASQRFCQENNIDFIDLSGNILIRVPGKMLLQRLNQPNQYKESRIFRNPFAGASSRVLRVLLNMPNKDWTVTGIEDELENESIRQNKKGLFSLSISSISKTIQSLEEEVLIRRDGMKIKVSDPKQILFHWAEKYRDRYKWMCRSSFKTNNPFGFEVESSIQKLTVRFKDLDIFVSGSAAANFVAPFVNVDHIDVFILDKLRPESLRSLSNERSVGPDFQFLYPYDNGVSMYAQTVKNIKIVSPIQIYLDCYARGGRDVKQAEYILNEKIEKEWIKSQ